MPGLPPGSGQGLARLAPPVGNAGGHTQDGAADFNDVSFSSEGETTRFSRRGDEFWVNTPAPTARLRTSRWPIPSASPVAAVLIEVGDGRLQALGVAWDTQKNRWFHLYPARA
ncbi:hypothetical protein DdX_21629 [Ditylenchus destructor]|uniref:Uncharacterized protein n=1 Tax=Ditylenchus destructor TaxID=166010 RepID=A0AAD4MFE8_9BILA|nr:hypothetical protein DdX_21629 [Ditylenchus destructor]